MNTKRIEYLDLEIETYNKVIRNLSRHSKLRCHFQTPHQPINHDFHCDQPVLNTIIDLIITLSIKLEEIHNHNNQVILNIRDRLIKLQSLVIEKLENIEYIKSQNNDMYVKIKSLSYSSSTNIKTSQDIIIEKIGSLLKNLEELKQLILS